MNMQELKDRLIEARTDLQRSQDRKEHIRAELLMDLTYTSTSAAVDFHGKAIRQLLHRIAELQNEGK